MSLESQTKCGNMFSDPKLDNIFSHFQLSNWFIFLILSNVVSIHLMLRGEVEVI